MDGAELKWTRASAAVAAAFIETRVRDAWRVEAKARHRLVLRR